MTMETLQSIPPMTWMIIVSAVIITVAVLFSKAIKALLKMAVILVMITFVVYFLVQAGIIELPGFGK